MFVQFEDKSQSKIVSVFDSPQSKKDFPNQGVVEEDDRRYIEFLTPKNLEPITDPLDKLKAFLKENPDVAEILK